MDHYKELTPQERLLVPATSFIMVKAEMEEDKTGSRRISREYPRQESRIVSQRSRVGTTKRVLAMENVTES